MSQALAEHGLERDVVAELSESEQHRLLADERRQVVLQSLPGRGTELSLDELAAAVLEREDGESGGEQASREEVAVSLHHVHLPVLDDLGVLDYDADSHRVAVQ